ncbi:hypothetical protein LXL04_031196 [Taraxacum kok-saghyz]
MNQAMSEEKAVFEVGDEIEVNAQSRDKWGDFVDVWVTDKWCKGRYVSDPHYLGNTSENHPIGLLQRVHTNHEEGCSRFMKMVICRRMKMVKIVMMLPLMSDSVRGPRRLIGDVGLRPSPWSESESESDAKQTAP